MTASVGAITAELKADPAVWEAALKRSVAALEKMVEQGEKTNSRLKQIASSSEKTASTLGGLTSQLVDLGKGYLTVHVAMELFNETMQESREIAAQAAFEKMGGSLERLGSAFHGMVDDDTIVKLANHARGLGVTRQETEALAEQSKGLARIMGTDVASAFEALSTATGTGSEKLLKGYGLTVDFKKAEEDLAKQLGATTAHLTEQGKEHARFGAITAATSKLTAQAGSSGDSAADAFEHMMTAGKNLQSTFTTELVPAFKSVAEVLEGAIVLVAKLDAKLQGLGGIMNIVEKLLIAPLAPFEIGLEKMVAFHEHAEPWARSQTRGFDLNGSSSRALMPGQLDDLMGTAAHAALKGPSGGPSPFVDLTPTKEEIAAAHTAGEALQKFNEMLNETVLSANQAADGTEEAFNRIRIETEKKLNEITDGLAKNRHADPLQAAFAVDAVQANAEREVHKLLQGELGNTAISLDTMRAQIAAAGVDAGHFGAELVQQKTMLQKAFGLAAKFGADGFGAQGQPTRVNSLTGATESTSGTTNKRSKFERDLEEGTAKLADIVRHGGNDLKKAFQDSAGSLISAFAGGNGFGALGQTLGAGLGGMASMAAGDPTGATGAAIGGALGSLLGGILDSLKPVLDATSEILGGLGSLITGGLGPILDTLPPLGQAVGSLLAGISPLLHGFSDAIAPAVVMVTDLINVFSPWIALIASIVGVLADLALNLMGMPALLSLVNHGLEWITGGVSKFYDSISNFVNSISEAIQSFHIGDWRPFADFSLHMDSWSELMGHSWAPATDKNTAALNKLTQSTQNLPTGYKLALNEFRTDPGRDIGNLRHTAQRPGQRAGTNVHFSGPVTFVAKDKNVLDQVHAEFQRRYGNGRSRGGGVDDDAN
jgi:hypothetical protein